MTTLTKEDREARIQVGRADVPEATHGPTDVWRRIPGTTELTRHSSICAAYVSESPDHAQWRAGDGGAVAYWLVFRWSVWTYGTLLAEGFAEYENAAMFCADQAMSRAQEDIRDAIKGLDIRRKG